MMMQSQEILEESNRFSKMSQRMIMSVPTIGEPADQDAIITIANKMRAMTPSTMRLTKTMVSLTGTQCLLDLKPTNLVSREETQVDQNMVKKKWVGKIKMLGETMVDKDLIRKIMTMKLIKMTSMLAWETIEDDRIHD